MRPHTLSAKTVGAKSGSPVVLKCDIEGGERQILFHIRDWEHLVRYILLELHTEFLSIPEMRECLESSGYHWTIHGAATKGAVMAFFLLERAAQRRIECWNIVPWSAEGA